MRMLSNVLRTSSRETPVTKFVMCSASGCRWNETSAGDDQHQTNDPCTAQKNERPAQINWYLECSMVFLS